VRNGAIEFHQIVAAGDVVILPAAAGENPVALGEVRVLGFDDAADGTAAHHFTDFYRRRVRWRVAHASAHIGVEGEIDRAQQHLAFAR